MKNVLVSALVVAMISAGSTAQAQSMSEPLARALETGPTPLTDSAHRAAVAMAKTDEANQPMKRRFSAKKCAAGVAIGTASGAALGFGYALWFLTVATGGSDSAAAFFKGYAGMGAMVGSVAGAAVGCRP